MTYCPKVQNLRLFLTTTMTTVLGFALNMLAYSLQARYTAEEAVR